MNVSEILSTTADRYASGEYRWARNYMVDPQGGGMCLAGGVAKTAGILNRVEGGADMGTITELLTPVAAAIRTWPVPAGQSVCGCGGCSGTVRTCTWWNDRPERTVGEVIEVLRRAAVSHVDGAELVAA